MVTRANMGKYLAVSVILLATAGTTFAEPLLFPMHVGLEHTFQKTIGDSTGSVVLGFTGKTTDDSMGYYLLASWNSGSSEPAELVDVVRSTEDAVYSYNPGGDEYLQLQKAPVGTKWTFYDPHRSGKNYKVIEIVAIERVTVPYGTFNKAYKHRKYRCETPEGVEASPDWYEWIVPGVGIVKQVDYWSDNPPEITELVSVYSELEDNMAATLAFFNESVSNGTLEGVGKGKGKKQLNDLKRMLETAFGLIEDGYNEQACGQLSEAYLRCDGASDPPDLVTGSAVVDLAERIQDVIHGLGCE